MRPVLALLVLLSAASLPGCDFIEDGYDPTVRVSQIVLTEAPLRRWNGDPWDEDGAADLQLEVQNVAGMAIRKSQVYTDLAALPEGGLVLDLDFPVDTDDRYLIVLIDIEGPGEVPQVMGVTDAFTYETLSGNEGATILVSNPDESTQALLKVEPGD